MFKSIRRFVEIIKTCISFSTDDMKFAYRLLKNKPKYYNFIRYAEKKDPDHLNFCTELMANKPASYEQIKRLYYVENISPLFMEYFDLFINIVGDENSGLSAGDMNFVFHALTHRDEKYYLAQELVCKDDISENFVHYGRILLNLMSGINEIEDYKIYTMFQFLKYPRFLEFFREYATYTEGFNKTNISDSFYKYLTNSNYAIHLQQIVHSLGADDWQIFNKIFLNMVTLSVINNMSLIDEEEKQEITKFRDAIERNRKVDENYQYFGKYRFKSDYEANVFVYKMGLINITERSINRIKNMDIIDCGACFGDSSFVLSSYTNKNVYAFEPVKSTYDIFSENIQLNHISNIIPMNFGLSDIEGVADIKINIESPGGSAISSETAPTKDDLFTNVENVNITTLDKFIVDFNIKVGVIKLDIEGFERKVLIGALSSIRKYKPVLLISIYHNASDFMEILPLIDSLNLNYKFKVEKTLKGNLIEETMLICEVTE